MRLKNLFEALDFNTSEFEDMELSDALYILAEMAEDGKLSEKEESIIEDMLDRIFDEEDDEIEMEEYPEIEFEDGKVEVEFEEDDDYEDLEEAEIADHTDLAGKRDGHARRKTMGDRILNRIYQRKYRRNAHVKMKAKKRAAKQKQCGKNQTAQLVRAGSTTYACKLKNRFKSKLMKRVMKRYR